jgi:hypothetical protein
MGCGSRRLLIVGTALGLGLGMGGLAITTAAPAPAQPTAAPFLPDGEWVGSLGASGPFDIADFHGEVIYGGTFEFTVWQGAITEGTWQVGGSGVAAHPRVSGSVTYWVSGTMTGVAAMPEMLPEGATVTYDLTVDGTPVSGTTDLGPELMTVIAIPIISSSCDIAIGNWTVPANLVYQQAGGTSTINGSWSATRMGGSELGGEDPDTLNEAMSALMRRALALADGVYQTGRFDFDALNVLATEAEWFNQRLILSAECEGRPLRGWVNPVGGTILGLLDWALNNPEQIDNAQLLRLVAAGVRTNVLGSRAPTNYLTESVRARLALELTARAEQARQDGDCAAAAVVNASADTLNDPVALAATQDAMAEVCP